MLKQKPDLKFVTVMRVTLSKSENQAWKKKYQENRGEYN